MEVKIYCESLRIYGDCEADASPPEEFAIFVYTEWRKIEKIHLCSYENFRTPASLIAYMRVRKEFYASRM